MRIPTPGWLARHPMRAALCASLGLIWINFLTTSRWAGVEGSLNGPKRPLVALALVACTVAALWRWPPRRSPGPSPLSAALVAIAGAIALAAAFFVWFPPHTWTLVPFLDDWPIRYHAALDMMRMIDSGSFVGWEWRFLGGYHSSSDATQGLGTLTYLPMKIFGPLLGFHLAHLALFAAVPVLVWLDLSLDAKTDRRTAAVAAGFAALLSIGYGQFLIRSGDTNSLGGVVVAMSAIAGAHAARAGRTWGPWVLVGALALTVYAHPAFFIYACIFLALDALLARDRRSAVRLAVAVVAALIASLPLTYESWRYPSLFSPNNVVYTAPPLNLTALARDFYYDVELTFMPHRWFNDYSGIAMVFAPIALALAFVDRSRTRFYAVALILTITLKWLTNVHTGYVFLRQLHLIPVWMAGVLAVLVVQHTSTRWLRWSFVALVCVYLQLWLQPVPHVPDIRAFDSELTRRITEAPGALVLLENNPHRNMNADPGGTTERSRFGTHFEPMFAETTGRRLYSGGYSDGWQWNPWKGQVLAGGTLMGRSIDAMPHDAFVAEMRRWGVASLFVWSDRTNGYLRRDARFVPTWTSGSWTEYRLTEADTRDVVTSSGSGTLTSHDAFGATITLSGVRRPDQIVVRTNYHPAWTAESNGLPIALGPSTQGQLAFAAPCDGACVVTLHYPRRRWLVPLAAAAVLLAAVAASRLSDRSLARDLRDDAAERDEADEVGKHL